MRRLRGEKIFLKKSLTTAICKCIIFCPYMEILCRIYVGIIKPRRLTGVYFTPRPRLGRYRGNALSIACSLAAHHLTAHVQARQAGYQRSVHRSSSRMRSIRSLRVPPRVAGGRDVCPARGLCLQGNVQVFASLHRGHVAVVPVWVKVNV